MVAIVDYNMGNLGSVLNAFDKVGVKAKLVSKPEKLKEFGRVVLPGVGAFPDAMEHLKSSGMDKAIVEFASSGKPLMGTCLGMQLLLDESEEFGINRGLGLIPGRVQAFDKSRFDHTLKVPHMGWNELFIQSQNPLFEGLPDAFYLYFVHSFHVVTESRYVIGNTYYGYTFASAIAKDNIYGFQPHPEKSHNNGLKIIKNFASL